MTTVLQTSPVVIVEDDADERTATGRVVRAGGFTVISFESAESFIASPPPRALCLLLDLQLDGMSGIELLRWLRAGGSALPVIVITASDDAESCREAEKLGCTAYVRKPFSGRALVALLQGLAGPRSSAVS